MVNSPVRLVMSNFHKRNHSLFYAVLAPLGKMATPVREFYYLSHKRLQYDFQSRPFANPLRELVIKPYLN